MAAGQAGPDGQGTVRPGRRQRHETYAEIVETARRLMRTEEGLSLRGVAAEMGMTPPALYRYVDSYRDLQLLVARAIFEDLVATMRRTIERLPDEDPGAQILLAAVTMRNWALANRAEFGMVYANPELAQGATPDYQAAGSSLGDVFAEIYGRLQRHYGFETPLPDDFTLERPAVSLIGPSLQEAGLAWLMLRHWVRVYGIITLEVYQQIPADVIESGALFLQAISDNAHELGMADDLPRLRPVVRAELQRPFVADADDGLDRPEQPI